VLVKSSKQPIVCIISLGYVGLPLAEAFSRHFKVIGFDTNIKLVKELSLHNNQRSQTYPILKALHQVIILLKVPSKISRDVSHSTWEEI